MPRVSRPAEVGPGVSQVCTALESVEAAGRTGAPGIGPVSCAFHIDVSRRRSVPDSFAQHHLQMHQSSSSLPRSTPGVGEPRFIYSFFRREASGRFPLFSHDEDVAVSVMH